MQPSGHRPAFVRELSIGGIAFGLGLIAMPVLIYIAGRFTLGAYQPDAGFGTFLKDFYSGLLRGSLPTWGVVLGPYVLFSLLRAALLIHRRLRL